MNLPSVVKTYFEADQGGNADAVVKVFSRDAVVEDEGARHEGIEAIRAWWVAAKRKYHHVAKPIDSSQTGDEVSVRAEVSGKFAGSPATLGFSFILADGEIVALRIG